MPVIKGDAPMSVTNAAANNVPELSIGIGPAVADSTVADPADHQPLFADARSTLRQRNIQAPITVVPDLSNMEHESLAVAVSIDRSGPNRSTNTTLSRVVMGAPLPRKQQWGETDTEYRLAKFIHWYDQRSRHLLTVFILFIIATVLYFYFAIPAGVGMGITVATQVQPYSHETMLARSHLKYANMLLVMNVTCANGTMIKPSISLDAETIGLFPKHEFTLRFQTMLMHSFALIKHDTEHTLPCVCAPLIGHFFRYVAFRHENGSFMHMINPRIENTTTKNVVRHSQAANFNIPKHFHPIIGNTSDVYVVRHDPLHVTYDSTRNEESTTFTGDLAYCIEECIDAHQGKTIWSKALEQYASGILVNKKHIAQIKQYEC